MAHRTRLTKGIYDKIVEGFRKYPAEFSKVGRFAGCDERTAKKAWFTGLPYPWAEKPIKDLITEEMVAARLDPPAAMMAADPVKAPPAGARAIPAGTSGAGSAGLASGGTPATSAKGRDAAVRARQEEAAIVELTRSSSLSFAASTAQLVLSLVSLAPRLQAALRRMLLPTDIDGNVRGDIPKDAQGVPVPDATIALYALPALYEDTRSTLALFREVLNLHRTAVYTSERVFVLDRKLLSGSGGKDGDDEWTPEQAHAEIQRLITQAAQRAKGLSHVPGTGDAATPPPAPAAPAPPPPLASTVGGSGG